MRISYDFDGVLTNPKYQETAKRLMKRGHEVWITSHHGVSDDNTELFETAEKIGIPKHRIQLVGEDNKSDYLKDFDLHFEDSTEDIEDIEANTDVPCVYCNGVEL